MNGKKFQFRPATEKEKDLVYTFVTEYFGLSSLNAFDNYSFWVKDGRFQELFIVPSNIVEYVSKLSEYIFSTGIPLGIIRKNRFLLEVEGGYFLSPYTTKIIQVKTDQYLYGKPIFASNAIFVDKNVKANDWVIIVGKNNLHYGVGQCLYPASQIADLDSNTIIIRGYKNKPYDRGWYLRRGA